MSLDGGKQFARIADLISISPASPVVSLGEVEGLRDALCAGKEEREQLADLLSGYSLSDPETRAAFEAMIRSLGRSDQRGDGFLVAGVYGTGKSHLLAALTLLTAHPAQAWPALLSSHPGYDRAVAGFRKPRVVVAIALDDYPSQSQMAAGAERPPAAISLEQIVLSRLEAELARRHGLRVALTEESHLLELVERYVVPQAGADLDQVSAAMHEEPWLALRHQAPGRAAQAALEFLHRAGFPLDWRRSRAEAWAALRGALDRHRLDGPVILLDELGLFLAGKDRRGLNADASFLQYLAQRTSAERCWLVGVTQRGLEEVGDIDRRTLRQLRGRFRPGFTLGLAELGWVLAQRLVRKRDAQAFGEAVSQLHSGCLQGWAGLPFTPEELARSYPLNPLCLEALQRAAETSLSQTRSVIALLQEAARERGWLDQPAERLVTPDLAFDVFREQLAMTLTGRRHLHAHEVVMANAGRIAPGQEQQLAAVMKALCLLGVAELRWPTKLLRGSLVGCAEAALWQQPQLLEDLLRALYRRGAYVERARREEGDEYYVDAGSQASERIRQRLNELTAELTLGDSRVLRAALEACSEEAFPLAGLLEPRSLAVEWWHARRFVSAVCRDLTGLTAPDLQNLVGALAAPDTREDGWLFIASPTAPLSEQEQAWLAAGRQLEGRFTAGLVAWLPRELGAGEQEQLIEHAALSRMMADPTVARPRDRDFRARLRQRWEDSESQVRRMLQRAFYEGKVVDRAGQEMIERPRLQGLTNQWEAALAALFDEPFRRLFPHFPAIAPDRRLAGRAQTNQIIEQFIRPGEVRLPPASTLEAHLLAYAAPLGLVEGEGGRYQLATKQEGLLQAAIGAAPERSRGKEVEPGDAIGCSELAGRLAKSEWGLTREQGELLIAALVRGGYLVALDAFLQPVQLEVIAAPLAENLPYLMRGAALRGPVRAAAQALWLAATGASTSEWDRPTQERAWRELVAWSAEMLRTGEARSADLARAAGLLGQAETDWSWAEEALARAQAVASAVSPTRTSSQGLSRLVAEAERLPGGVAACSQALARCRGCARFLETDLADLARLRALISDQRATCSEESLLARDRQGVLTAFASPARLVSAASQVRALASRWLEAYRRHYLGWHGSQHAAPRFGGLAQLQRSPVMEAARRLARAGLAGEAVAAVDRELNQALGRRCLAADPLPGGSVVCPGCGLRLGEELTLPDVEALSRQAEEALAAQRAELRAHEELLRRRLPGCADERVAAAVAKVLAEESLPPERLTSLLTDELLPWLSQQLGQPQAKRRELRDLEPRLRGKELTGRQIAAIVEEWLGGGPDDVIEIV